MDLKELIPDMPSSWGAIISTWLGALGLGGGGSWLGLRLIDKEQNKKIKTLEDKVENQEGRVRQLETDMLVNTKFDKEFRDQYSKDQEATLRALNRIEEAQRVTHSHIFEIASRK